MLPEPPPVTPTAPEPAPQQPVTPPPPPPTATPGVPDQAGFEGWKQGFLNRHGGVRRAQYERELAGLTPDPSVIRLDRNQPEFSRPVWEYLDGALSPLRVRNGDRVAQAEIVPVDQVTFELADELSVTARGVGGFGSTGT